MIITNVTAYLAKDWRTYLYVVVDTDEGIYGVWEAGITGRELAVAGAVEHFKPLLIGQDPFRTEHIWQLLFRGGFFPAQNILSAALSAIDIALWDIKGKALGVPVYQLLGGKARDKVACYCHCLGATVDELVASCQTAVAAGWKHLRWGLWHHPGAVFEPRPAVDLAIQEFEAVRAAVGDEIELCLDVHTRLNLRDAVRLCRAVEKFRPYFIEDPLRSENPDSFKQLRNRTAIHNPLGPVSGAAALHLNLSCPNFGVQELAHLPGLSMPDAILGQPLWEAGCLLPSDKPGLGIEINREALQRYTFALTELPHFQREDGSFTNW